MLCYYASWESRLDDVQSEDSFTEPYVLAGVIYDISVKAVAKPFTKFEQVLSYFETFERKVFKDYGAIDYEDSYLRFKGQLEKTNLFDIKDSQDVMEMIVKPCLDSYRKLPG